MLRILLAGVAALAVSTPALSGDLSTDAAAFGAREAVIAPNLSPDGSTVMYLTPGVGRKTIAVAVNLDTGATQKIAAVDGSPEALRWCNFVSLQRAVCQVTGSTVAPATGDIIGFSRLISLKMDGSDPKLLGQTDRFNDGRLRQSDGEIVDWLANGSGSVLMERDYVPEVNTIGTNIHRDQDGLGVDRIDVASLRSTPVESPKATAGSYMTDGQGNVRIMGEPESNNSGMLTGTVRYHYRVAGSRDWKSLATVRHDEFQPLAVDATSNSLYALKKLNGRMALYTIALDGTLTERLVAQNPRVDIDDVVRIGRGQRVIGYTYAEDVRTSVYFDPEFDALARSLGKALPNEPLVDFVDASADGRKLLIFAGSDVDPGRYYLFDKTKRSLTEAMLARPELKGRPLASVKTVSIPLSDGGTMLAYLTLPPGKDARNLPAVVFPHGGPSARDEWGFDWIPQFLAARGYAVIQPQYRGSAGFGDSWLNDNGFKNWRTSIGDISTATRWLASQGIADPRRTAIVGWSYGGYAALQSAAIEPTLYKAVVAVAPVTDLAQLKQEAEGFTNARLVDRIVGSGPHIVEGSPIHYADAISVPVLLVHGDLDSNVRYRQSARMDAALRAAGKPSEFLSFKGLDHQLDDSSARTQLLTRMAETLDRAIGH